MRICKLVKGNNIPVSELAMAAKVTIPTIKKKLAGQTEWNFMQMINVKRSGLFPGETIDSLFFTR